MPDEPEIIELVDQPYAAIRAELTMQTISQIADRIPEVFAHLAERGIAPTGPPFLKYDVICPGDQLEVEAGVPVADVSEGAGPVAFAILRDGRYATVSHRGHFEGLADATAGLLRWGAEHDLTWDMDEVDGAESWGARLEVYNSDPSQTPDPADWVTDLLFRLA